MAKLRTLRQCPLFQALGYRELAILAHHVHENQAKLGEWVVKEGDPSSGVLILQSGKFQVVSKENAPATLDLGPGEYIGEFSLANGGSKRNVGVKTLEVAQYLSLSPGDFHRLKETWPEIAGKISEGLLASAVEKMSTTVDLLRTVMNTGDNS